MGIEAKNVCFYYKSSKTPILKGLNLSISEGESVALTGPSGYGKSTLAKLLSGYEKPQFGEVLLDGQTLPKSGVSPIQLIYQHPEKGINPCFRMKDVLEEAMQFDKKLIEKLGIKDDWMNRYPHELSGGELQRFCIARSLIPSTKYLIADEISTMLDAISSVGIWEIIRSECKERKIALLMITHNTALARRVCNRVVDIRDINPMRGENENIYT